MRGIPWFPNHRHDHYDHLDYGTVRDLGTRFPDAKWFVPLRCKALVQSFGAKRVYELDWWEERIEWFQNQDGAPEDDENAGPDNDQLPRKRADELARATSCGHVPRNRVTTVRIVCTPSQHFSGKMFVSNLDMGCCGRSAGCLSLVRCLDACRQVLVGPHDNTVGHMEHHFLRKSQFLLSSRRNWERIAACGDRAGAEWRR